MWRAPWWLPFGSVPEIEPAELKRRLDRGDPVRLVDVRTPPEFEGSHIDGARSIPLHELRKRIDEIDEDGPAVVAICKTAHRSIPAVRLLRRHGIDAYQLAGGMDRWRKEID